MTSSIYPKPFTIAATPIAANSSILTSDIAITASLLKPGGGGILRIYFAFEFDVGEPESIINILNNGVLNGKLNSDNDESLVATDGYYTFDIDVEAGDNINFRPEDIIETVRVLRAHLILEA